MGYSRCSPATSRGQHGLIPPHKKFGIGSSVRANIGFASQQLESWGTAEDAVRLEPSVQVQRQRGRRGCVAGLRTGQDSCRVNLKSNDGLA